MPAVTSIKASEGFVLLAPASAPISHCLHRLSDGLSFLPCRKFDHTHTLREEGEEEEKNEDLDVDEDEEVEREEERKEDQLNVFA